MTPPIFDPIMGDRLFPVRFGWNNRLGPTLLQRVAYRVVVESFVAEQSLKRQTVDQVRHADAVVALPRPQRKAHEIAQCIDQRQNLRCQATFRAADGLTESPPFAPLAF